MSDRKNTTRYTGLDRRAPPAEPGALKPDALKPGAVNPGAQAPREAMKTGGRHSAITTNLYNWNSYKTWADKVRGSWDDKK